MRSRRPTSHSEAVSRRLQLLSAELASVRAEAGRQTSAGADRAPAAGSAPANGVDDGDTQAGAGAGSAAGWAAWAEVPDSHTRIRPARSLERPGPAIPSTPPTPALPRAVVAPPEPVAQVGVGAGVGPAVVPTPGRHASRRAAGPPGWLPPTLHGRVALAPAHLTVLAVLVAFGVALTAWWSLRGDPGEVVPAAAPLGVVPGLETPAAEATSVQPSGSPTAPGGASSADGSGAATLVVDVVGKVRRPGIVVLDPGARVHEAIAAAGGLLPGVDLQGLNQARLVVDGEQIVVGAPAPAGLAASSAPAATPGAGSTGLVNLNTATQEQLETLPGVGPVTAQAILDWRTAHGAFRSVEELLEVDGIGDATLADLAPHVTL